MYNFDSYQSHEENIVKMTNSTNFDEFARQYFTAGLISSWIVQLFNDPINPILLSDPKSTWLTIGDGRYGSDAHYIMKHGNKVLATDISDAALKIGKEREFIEQYKKENAEQLSFENKSFHYTLCKESLHHFPRPFIGIYEMLRVSSKGIILIEPCDQYIFDTNRQIIFRKILELLSRIKYFNKIFKEIKRHTYEEAGNYVYKISRREIEKIALGLNLKYIAFKNLNFIDIPGDPNELADKSSKRFRKIRTYIYFFNLLCKLKLSQPTNMCSIIFIESPSDVTLKLLKKSGFEIVSLPANPYAH